MRKASKYFITAALGLMTLAGCANGENAPVDTGRNDSPSFTATISGLQSRAFDEQWESGDVIGISGANRYNVGYTSNGQSSFTVKNSGEQIYFPDDNEVVFTAYYPWNALTAGSTAINADTRKQNEQKNFDFLWAQATGKKDAPDVAFTFAHKMAKVVLTVKPGEAMSYDEVKETDLSLDGFRHTGSFDTADGTTTVDDTAEPWEFSGFAGLNDTAQALSFTFIVFPQEHSKPLDFLATLELSDGTLLSLKAAIDFTSANKEKDGDNARNEWVAGRQYNLSVTLNKSSITLDGCGITPWTSVTGEDITVD